MLVRTAHPRPLRLSRRASRLRALVALAGHGVLLLITSSSALAVLFIFFYIARDAVPFFQLRGLREFFTSTHWYPSRDPAEFGALAIFVGSGLVTLGAALVAVPLGVLGAVCLSDVLPFSFRQIVKPVIEVLAAIPSVAYGFFALVVFAPLLQSRGGTVLMIGWWCLAGPLAALALFVLSDLLTARVAPGRGSSWARVVVAVLLTPGALLLLVWVGQHLAQVQVPSGANALNVSIILGIMALPTITSVSEDALQAVGRELREGAYALGATRAEVLVRVVIPAAASGICAAVILGLMRAIGETMVVWMASGNAAQIPQPWYNLLQPVRTLTATIAGDMGEADHVTGSARYHVLFAMALALLTIAFICNLVSERVIRRSVRRHG
ncbi:MAG: phosphate ABC transporter permease subunit PstC [Phycisphaerae bacterium]|nr:phosphate ABC transporter permease subunit PstC [Phycisphaerae bacterium]